MVVYILCYSIQNNYGSLQSLNYTLYICLFMDYIIAFDVQIISLNYINSICEGNYKVILSLIYTLMATHLLIFFK